MSSFGQDPTIFSWFSPNELSFIWQEETNKNVLAHSPMTVIDVDSNRLCQARLNNNNNKQFLQRQQLLQSNSRSNENELNRIPSSLLALPKTNLNVDMERISNGAHDDEKESQHSLWENVTRCSNDAPIFEEASETYFQQQKSLLPSDASRVIEPPILPRVLPIDGEDSFDHATSTSSAEDAVADSFDPATEDEEELDGDGNSIVMDDSLDAESIDDTLGLEDDNFDASGAADGVRLDAIKLKASKSPIMDALVYCALNGWGIKLTQEDGDDIQFQVVDFKKYYKYSARICAKQNPTEDQASRIKALKRWFPDFPTKRERGKIESPFSISVSRGSKKDNKPKKMREIIERNRRLLGIQKTRRAR